MSHSVEVVCSPGAWRGQVRDWGDVAEQVRSAEVSTDLPVCRARGARKWASQISAEIRLSILAGVILALIVAAAGAAMPRSAALADLDAAVETRVIEADGMEPFIVCTTRAQVTTCQELNLSADHR